MSARPDAPATRRNQDAILAVLRDEFSHVKSVLEIGSGTGQHAVHFGGALPSVRWQTSDLPENHAGINAWLAAAALQNVIAPFDVDVTKVTELPGQYDGVFSANTAHIMGFEAVRCMFRLVGNTLTAGGIFCLYGPFNQDGRFTSESNERFDASLKQRDPAMGIRNLDDVAKLAAASGLEVVRQYMMPANNMLIVFRKSGEAL